MGLWARHLAALHESSLPALMWSNGLTRRDHCTLPVDSLVKRNYCMLTMVSSLNYDKLMHSRYGLIKVLEDVIAITLWSSQ